MGLRGGGKRGRSSGALVASANPFKEGDTDYVKDTDSKLFESVFITATDMRMVNVNDMLKNMDIDTLKEMSSVLSSANKTNHVLKIKLVVDNRKIVKDMVAVREKLSKSIEITKAKIEAALWEHVCEQSDDNNFEMTILKMNISAFIKAKQEMQV